MAKKHGMPNKGKNSSGSKGGATNSHGHASGLTMENKQRRDGKSGIKHHNPYPRGLA